MSRAVKESMKLERKLRRALRLSPLLWLLGSGGCAAVLGIEDIHEGPAEGVGGDGATGGTKPNTAGDKTGGSKSNGGTSATGGADALAGTANEGGSGNEAGAGGAPVNTDPTVRGHVIDFWGQDVPNIPIQIGDVLGSTDKNGEFVFEEVPAEYDVSLAVELDSITSHGWVFQGLTRRDPTLHIYSGSPSRSGDIEVQALDITLGNNQQAVVTIGALGGAAQFSLGQQGIGLASFSWRGGTTTQGTAHALAWTTNASDLPTSYQGFDSSLVSLGEIGSTAMGFTLSGTAPESGNVTGIVTPNTSIDRENDAFLRFPSGDRVHLVEDYTTAPDNFSYVVPDVAMASVTVSASEGDADYEAYAVVHKDGLGVGSTAALKIPAPGTLVAPVDDITGVDLTTKFSYLAGAGSGAMHVVAIHNIYDSCCYDALYIVTNKTQLTIPEVVGANFLKGNEGYYWGVETHGNYQTADEMTGPSGFLDSFSADEATPQGPNQSDGLYTITLSRVFTPAP